MTKTLIAKRDRMMKYDQYKVFCTLKTKQVLFEKLLMFCSCLAAADSTNMLLFALQSSSWCTGSPLGRTLWTPHQALGSMEFPPREKVSADDRWTLAKNVVIFGMKPRHQISVELSWVFVLSFQSSPFFSFLCSVSPIVSHFVSLFPFLFCRCVFISSSFSQADTAQKEMHIFLKNNSLWI